MSTVFGEAKLCNLRDIAVMYLSKVADHSHQEKLMTLLGKDASVLSQIRPADRIRFV